MRNVLLLLLLSAAVPLPAQDSVDEQSTRVVPVKYADVETIVKLLSDYAVVAMPDTKARAITLTGPFGEVDKAEAVIHEFDVAPPTKRDVDLTLYFVLGSDAPPGPHDLPVPPGMAVLLRGGIRYKNYVLLDELSLRSRSGTGAEATGVLSGARVTELEVRSARIAGTTIHLEHVHAGLRVPCGAGPDRSDRLESGVTSESLDIHAGGRLLLGRSSVQGPQQSVFLILAARVAP